MAALTLNFQFFVLYSYTRTNQASFTPQMVQRYFIYNNPSPIVAADVLTTALQAEILTNDGASVAADAIVIRSIEELNNSFGSGVNGNAQNFKLYDIQDTTMANCITQFNTWTNANPTFAIQQVIPYYNNIIPTKINLLVNYLSPS